MALEATSNGWAAAYQVENIDLPRKGKLFVPGAIQKLPAINAYGAHTSALELGPGFILRENSENKISRRSAVKFLVKAYAFDDQLLIENRLIKNPGNRGNIPLLLNTIIFLKTTMLFTLITVNKKPCRY